MTSFWLSNPCVLTSSINLFPFGDELNENFNALARIIIILTIGMTFAFEEHSDLILISGGFALLISVLLYFMVTRLSVNFSRDNMIFEANVGPSLRRRGLRDTEISDFNGLRR